MALQEGFAVMVACLLLKSSQGRHQTAQSWQLASHHKLHKSHYWPLQTLASEDTSSGCRQSKSQPSQAATGALLSALLGAVLDGQAQVLGPLGAPKQ